MDITWRCLKTLINEKLLIFKFPNFKVDLKDNNCIVNDLNNSNGCKFLKLQILYRSLDPSKNVI